MSKAKTLTEEERETSGAMLAVILLCVTIVWATGGWLVDSKDTVNRGTFGDMFGAVNALFSGLAFATLIYTTFLQRWELRETRRELARTTAAQEASELALRAQAQAAEHSAHLATVTALLSHYREELTPFKENSFLQYEQSTKYRKLQERESALISLLDIAYHQVTTAQAKRDKEPFPMFPVTLNPENRS